MSRPVIVLKFGSSVLTSESAITTAIHEIYRWYRQGYAVIAVVSAIGRTTDKLLAQAKEYGADPDPSHLASLLATGESVSAGLVALGLDRAGIPACILDPARIDLRTQGNVLDSEPCSVDVDAITEALADRPVAVVPGFFGRLEDGRTALLGRGGSDLSALFIAYALQARCRLIKDVDGLYEADPNKPGPRPRRFASISWDDALKIDGRIIQHKAVRFAKSLGLSIEVGCVQRDGCTVVGPGPSVLRSATVAPERPIRVALLGLGVVGYGVYRELIAQPDVYQVTGIAVREPAKHRDRVPAELLTTDAWSLVEGDADVVVEAIGGRYPAFDFLARALERGKHVVTANKAVIAGDGAVLAHKAETAGVTLTYSAAVGGGVPVIETVSRVARSKGIRCIEGVVNGTTNFILDRLADGEPFPSAVAGAQSAGFAEADPTTDLNGTDAAHKLAIIVERAFGERIDPASIDREGILGVDPERVRGARACGCELRLVARAQHVNGRVSASVRVQTLPSDHPLAGVSAESNRVLIWTADGDSTIVNGRGAGRWPTTESVVGDLFDAARRIHAEPSVPHVQSTPRSHAEATLEV